MDAPARIGEPANKPSANAADGASASILDLQNAKPASVGGDIDGGSDAHTGEPTAIDSNPFTLLGEGNNGTTTPGGGVDSSLNDSTDAGRLEALRGEPSREDLDSIDSSRVGAEQTRAAMTRGRTLPVGQAASQDGTGQANPYLPGGSVIEGHV